MVPTLPRGQTCASPGRNPERKSDAAVTTRVAGVTEVAGVIIAGHITTRITDRIVDRTVDRTTHLWTDLATCCSTGMTA